jgi:hypothetical protein
MICVLVPLALGGIILLILGPLDTFLHRRQLAKQGRTIPSARGLEAIASGECTLVRTGVRKRAQLWIVDSKKGSRDEIAATATWTGKLVVDANPQDAEKMKALACGSGRFIDAPIAPDVDFR